MGDQLLIVLWFLSCVILANSFLKPNEMFFPYQKTIVMGKHNAPFLTKISNNVEYIFIREIKT